MGDNGIEIIGKGCIGDKVNQLIIKTGPLQRIGFHFPKRIGLSQSFYDDFLRGNDLGDRLEEVKDNIDLETRIREGRLTEEQLDVLKKTVSSLGVQPVVVRSSAAGDARGTGAYETHFCMNNADELSLGIQKVFASYFSKDAIAFRQLTRTNGFGVIIEPLIGQIISQFIWDLDHNMKVDGFSPVLSGFGYTNSSRDGPYLGIVPGLGGGVQQRDVERITEDAIQAYKNLGEYIIMTRGKLLCNPSHGGPNIRTYSSLLHLDNLCETNRAKFKAAVYVLPKEKHLGGVNTYVVHFKDELVEAINKLDLRELFGMMHKMEQEFGKSQYFEWAITIENGKPIYWITQIDDVDPKLDLIDFAKHDGDALMEAHTVVGYGEKKSNKIVVCNSWRMEQELKEFNSNNQDYILVYSSSLTSQESEGTGEKLPLSMVSNAGALIEIPGHSHINHPTSHWQGLVDQTRIYFGVLDFNFKMPDYIRSLLEEVHREGRLPVYEAPLVVVAGERQNKMRIIEVQR